MTAGDDTARPAGWESSDRAAMLAIREGRVPADHPAAGPRAGDATPDGLTEVRKTLQDAIDERDSAWAGRIKASGEELHEMKGAAALAESILTALGPAAPPADAADRIVTELCEELGVERAELVDRVNRDRLVMMAFDATVREETARLRAAGDALADAADEREDIPSAIRAWRSAAGSPTTDGEASR